MATPCGCQHARHVHGTNRMYISHRCKCLPCCDAHAAAAKANRRGESASERNPAILLGGRRRLQALAVMGHSAPLIAAAVGTSWRFIVDVRSPNGHGHLSIAVGERIQAYYAANWDNPLRDSPGARRVTTYARRSGWHPPLAWDDIDDPGAQPWTPTGRDTAIDEIAVERIMAGTLHPERFTYRRELAEAVRRLAAQGMADTQIGRRVGRTTDAVLKIRERNGIPAALVPGRNAS